MKRLSLREKFEESYMAVPAPAKNGRGGRVRYIYYAPWYIWAMPEKALKREKALLLSLSLGSLALFVFTVTRASPLNSQKLLYALDIGGLCAHILELSALVQLAFARYRTTKMTYTEVSGLLGSFPPFRAVLLGLSAAMGLLYCLTLGLSAADLAVAAGRGASAAAAWAIHRRYARIPVVTEKNTALAELEKQGEDFAAGPIRETEIGGTKHGQQ